MGLNTKEKTKPKKLPELKEREEESVWAKSGNFSWRILCRPELEEIFKTMHSRI